MKDKEQFFETILKFTSDVLMICDRNRHVVYITPNAYEISGYGPEEWKNRDTFFFLHPEDKEYMLKRHRNLLTSQQKSSSEYRTIKNNGEIMYCECKTTPLPDTENYLQVVSMRDITERKRMQIELEYHKNRHEVLQNSLKNFSNDLTSVMKLPDLEDRLIKEIEAILPGSNPIILTAFPTEARDLVDGNIVRGSGKLFIKIGERREHPYILSLQACAVRESMETIWLETLVYYAMTLFENLNMIENLMHQVETETHRKETPQWLLRMMFHIQEQQRLTLSSDLHDTVLQNQIDLYRRLESVLQRNEIEKEAKSKLIKIEQGLLDIIHEIRMTCNNLRPPLLRELGLERSLENLFEHIQLTSTYKINFTSEGLNALSLSEEETIGMYRIVQELLHYAEEVSKATVVTIDFHYKNEGLKMVYKDDGVAIVSDPANMRLASVSQRAQSLGGEVEMTSKPSRGFCATVTLPLNGIATIHPYPHKKGAHTQDYFGSR
ncbi:PAS domain-containing sensor histidine kinase [Bacillus sp. Marseille-P3661]|uniref:PAS domain-containing sensor histidine kinase n=1 Tax=Bacillus sp. Marseille-P3661 TaxID=1936234 RepID=UPI000C81F703|nr:PAS domain S-box protein [Bacillus sp. Marseille-P3661]